MRIKLIVVLSLFLIVVIGLISFGVKFEVKADPRTIIVPDDYPSIQEAINNAIDGDTIYVRAGVYYENIVINKSVRLIGENIHCTIIDGSKESCCDLVEIQAPEAEMINFTVRNAPPCGHPYVLGTAGIYLNTSHATIKNCIVSSNQIGIVMYGGSNRILESIIRNNRIAACFCSGKNLFGYNLIVNNEFALYFYGHGRKNNVTQNIFINNSVNIKFTGAALFHWALYQFVDKTNSFDGKHDVYFLINERDKIVPYDAQFVALINCVNITIQYLNLCRNIPAIGMLNSRNCTIRYNTINSSVHLTNSHYNLITFNNFTSGLTLDFSDNNIIQENIIRARIHLSDSDNNSISRNKFINSGLKLSGSSFNIISNESQKYILVHFDSERNLFINNTVEIFEIVESEYNILRNNRISYLDIYDYSDNRQISHYIHDIDVTNTVGEKPILYLVGKDGVTITGEYGFIGLINCYDICLTDVTLNGHRSSEDYTFLKVVNTTKANFTKCYFYNVGINIMWSSKITMIGNSICMKYPHITEMFFFNSSNTVLFHNIIIGRSFYLVNSSVSLDNGYPIGGNYWGNFPSQDFYSGPYQNITGADGICDYPLIINENLIDRYPLVNPPKELPPSQYDVSGVKENDWALYSCESSFSTNMTGNYLAFPPSIDQLKMQVLSVRYRFCYYYGSEQAYPYDPTALLNITSYLTNGTVVSETANFGIDSGSCDSYHYRGLIPFLIAPNLIAGEEIYEEQGMTINRTIVKTYQGIERTINELNLNLTFFDDYRKVQSCIKWNCSWDRETGILLEEYLILNQVDLDDHFYYNLSLTICVIDSNIFHETLPKLEVLLVPPSPKDEAIVNSPVTFKARVVCEGQPVEGAYVNFYYSNGTVSRIGKTNIKTDSEGYVEIEDWDPKFTHETTFTWWAEAWKEGYESGTSERRILTYIPPFVPPTEVMLYVPYEAQGTADWCWAASTAMVLRYYGKNVHVWDIGKKKPFLVTLNELETLIQLSYPDEFETEIKSYSSITNETKKDMMIYLDMGYPIILHVDTPGGGTHMVVVTGYNSTGFFINDPSGALLEAIDIDFDWPAINEYISWDELKPFIFREPISNNVFLVVKGTPNPIDATLHLINKVGVWTEHDLDSEKGVCADYGGWWWFKGMYWKSNGWHPIAFDSKDKLNYVFEIFNHNNWIKRFNFHFQIIGEDGITYYERFFLNFSIGPYDSQHVAETEIPLKEYLVEGQQYTITAEITDAETNETIDCITLPPIAYSDNSIMFMAECPVKMLITDPDGLRIGYDPSSNQTINEIPYATYYPGNETLPEIIMIPYKKNGNYTVKIFGTQDGKYNLTCISLNQTGHISIWNITNIPVSKDEYQTYIIPEYPSIRILLSAILIITSIIVLIRKKHKQQQTTTKILSFRNHIN